MIPTYHVVSHSHWDREWYRTFEQFRSMLVVMVDDLLELLDRDPRFAHFTLDGQTVLIDDYLAVRPERRDVLRERISSGRIMVGPWYVLPDEFLVSGEATIRNLLQGTRSARELGGMMPVGYIPDSFGHIAMMPAILRGFGIETALVYRGFGGEPGQTSSEYWWHAPDGSRVLMVHLFRHGYSAGYFHQESDAEIIRRFGELKAELDVRAATSHRLLMNGGDHHWPDPKLPASLDLLRTTFEGRFVHSTIPAYVAAAGKEIDDLPQVHGEMRFGYRYAFAVLGGVYSSRTYLKQANWRCQNFLQRYVEPIHALARLQGAHSRLPLIRHAWRTLMQNHPHDSICGCSIDPVHREMMVRFKAVEDVGGSVIEESLKAMVPYDDRATRDDRYLMFFNPSPFKRSEVAPAEVRFFRQDIVVGLNPDVRVDPKRPRVEGFVLRDARGLEVPYQRLDMNEEYDITYTNYNYPTQTYADRCSLLVDAQNVPALGIAGLSIHRRKGFPKYRSTLSVGKNFLENGYLRVVVNSRGEVTLVDKRRRQTYRGLNVFADSGDVGDEYNYSYPGRDRVICSRHARVTAVEKGPLRGALRVSMVMRLPVSATPDRRARSRRTVAVAVTSTLYLTRDGEALEVETTVKNTAKDHRLRVLFPTGTRTDTAVVDSQFTVIERKQQKYNLRKFTIEHPAAVAPMQRFVAARDRRRGLVLMSDGLPEYELLLDRDRTLALTLLRCVGLLAGEDLLTRPGGKAGWHNETPDAQCIGNHTFRYALMPLGAIGEDAGAAIQRACESFHLPLFMFRRKNTDPLPLNGTSFAVDNQRLVFSALKEAEEGDDVILRLYNPTAKEERATLRSTSGIGQAWLARLDEQPLSGLVVHENHELSLGFQPNEIITLRLRMAQ